jgi:hypothetical protein
VELAPPVAGPSSLAVADYAGQGDEEVQADPTATLQSLRTDEGHGRRLLRRHEGDDPPRRHADDHASVGGEETAARFDEVLTTLNSTPFSVPSSAARPMRVVASRRR